LSLLPASTPLLLCHLSAPSRDLHSFPTRRSSDLGVTALLATHRLQDGFALANFHFDPRAERVVANSRNGGGPAANAARTRFLVYREGEIYFEGEPEEIVNTKDSYLKRFSA